MPLIDASGIIPPDVSTAVTAVAVQQSTALQLGRRVPMPTGVSKMPVQASIPQASWLTSVGGRKPWTNFGFSMLTMTAEEVAAVIAIPQVYLDDSSIDLWAFARPQLGAAIARALDTAVLFGTNAPATFPAGGITAAAYCQSQAAGSDTVDTVNKAMALVEAQGLTVNGSSADNTVKAPLRGIRDTTGAFLLSPNQGAQGATSQLFGVPIAFSEYPAGKTQDFITGDWNSLIIGVRQDIRYDIDSSGVLADAAGVVLVSAFQDDVVLMRVYARYGCLVAPTPTIAHPTGAKPWASADLATGVTPG